MKTKLPTEIKTVEQAKDLLRQLYLNNESFHPDDSAETILQGMTDNLLFTPEEAKKLNKLISEIHLLANFDVYEFLLYVGREDERYFIKDCSGREGHYETDWKTLWYDEEMTREDDEFINWLSCNNIGDSYTEKYNMTITRIK